jgi:hypothetical protein
MTAKTGSANSSYAGLLPIEPPEDFFRPIDLKPEPIKLKPEDVPFPNWQPSPRKRPRAMSRSIAQGGAAPLQPAARLTEERPPQTLAEKRKPLSAKSGQDGSCFASAAAVLQNHPGGWPTWTLRAPAHEGSICWYAAARPRGSDHRRERMPKEKETAGTAEHELFAPVAPYGRGGSWEGGLP